MKATELRIGNWVMYSSKIQVNENKIKECVDHPDRFAPIPLTEEWLLRFGFEKGKELGRSLNYYYIQLEFENWQYRMVKNTTDDDWILHQGFMNQWSMVRESIDYVHQLQNLYFALTGEELQTDETKGESTNKLTK